MEGIFEPSKDTEKNKIIIVGEIISGVKYSHETCNEKFYEVKVSVKRLSGDVDQLDIIVSEKVYNPEELKIGKLVYVEGEVRSYNYYIEEEARRKLLISVFAKEIKDVKDEEITTNEVTLEGFICKKPIYRKTPFGREITDILLAVNRVYGKSDYLPCISWGRNAKYGEKFEVGDIIKVTGRLQSREYTKKIEDKEIKKVAYEISVATLEKIVEKVEENN